MQRRLASLIALLIALAGVSVITLTVTASPSQAKDLNCDDFPTQAAAQNNLNNNPSDPNGLDTDGDGIACESNPCPCTTGGGGGGGGGQPAPHKKKHALTAKVKKSGPAKKLTVLGKVTTFKGGKVQIQRKTAGGGFRAYRTATASKKSGAFNRPVAYVGNSKTCFQVIAPETKKYLRTVKFLGCFYKP